jgi:hypothetical protein
MHHTDADNAAAGKKAMELLQPKELADANQFFGLYLQQLQVRAKALKALNEPMIGDSLLKSDGTFWLQGMLSKSPKLNVADLKQQAAMPLSSFLRFDPWTDQVLQLHTAFEPLMSSRDKLPFEITPVYMKLTYWKPEAPPAAAPAASNEAPAGNTAADASAPAATTAPAASTPPQN